MVDLGDMNYEYGGDPSESPVGWLEDAETQARERINEAVERARERAAIVETAVRFGTPSREITAYAEDADVDGIVLGSHGREDVSWTLRAAWPETSSGSRRSR